MMKHSITWQQLALESENIAKDVLDKKFLSDKMYQSYLIRSEELKSAIKTLNPQEKASIQKHLEMIDTRLKILNPDHRIQTNFQFFTRQIHHFKNRLELLYESLKAFPESNVDLSIHQVKKAKIQKEIALLESQMRDALNLREALLA